MTEAHVIEQGFGALRPSGPVTVREQSRIVRIQGLFITGPVLIEKQASQIVLADCYILGSIRVAGGAFHVTLENLWIDHAPEHGIHIGDGAGMAGCANTLRNVHVRWAKHWGIVLQNQQALTLIGASADANGAGGILASSANGSYICPSAESNPIGLRLYDCRASVSGANLADNTTPLRVDAGQVDIRP